MEVTSTSLLREGFKSFIVQAPDTDSIQLFSLSITESKLERPWQAFSDKYICW